MIQALPGWTDLWEPQTVRRVDTVPWGHLAPQGCVGSRARGGYSCSEAPSLLSAAPGLAPPPLRQVLGLEELLLDADICQDNTLADSFVCASDRGMLEGTDPLTELETNLKIIQLESWRLLWATNL